MTLIRLLTFAAIGALLWLLIIMAGVVVFSSPPDCLPDQQQEQLEWSPDCPGLPG